eukprot:4573315-Heterocapsa_arctica.AAC.1
MRFRVCPHIPPQYEIHTGTRLLNPTVRDSCSGPLPTKWDRPPGTLPASAPSVPRISKSGGKTQKSRGGQTQERAPKTAGN